MMNTYLPATVGSSWTYKYSIAAGSVSNVTFTLSGKDTVVNGRTYKVYANSNGANQYYIQNSTEYYTLKSLATNILELLILKDNVDVNATWTSSQVLSGLSGLPGGLSSATINATYKVESKGATRVVNGTTYSNVIKVRADLVAPFPIIGNLQLGYFEIYFAKNIGIIENNTQLSNATMGLNVNELYTLQSYIIK